MRCSVRADGRRDGRMPRTSSPISSAEKTDLCTTYICNLFLPRSPVGSPKRREPARSPKLHTEENPPDLRNGTVLANFALKKNRRANFVWLALCLLPCAGSRPEGGGDEYFPARRRQLFGVGMRVSGALAFLLFATQHAVRRS